MTRAFTCTVELATTVPMVCSITAMSRISTGATLTGAATLRLRCGRAAVVGEIPEAAQHQGQRNAADQIGARTTALVLVQVVVPSPAGFARAQSEHSYDAIPIQFTGLDRPAVHSVHPATCRTAADWRLVSWCLGASNLSVR